MEREAQRFSIIQYLHQASKIDEISSATLTYFKHKPELVVKILTFRLHSYRKTTYVRYWLRFWIPHEVDRGELNFQKITA
jgi:hypothetical protein